MEAILIRNAEALTEGDEIVGKVPQDQGVFSQTFLDEDMDGTPAKDGRSRRYPRRKPTRTCTRRNTRDGS